MRTAFLGVRHGPATIRVTAAERRVLLRACLLFIVLLLALPSPVHAVQLPGGQDDVTRIEIDKGSVMSFLDSAAEYVHGVIDGITGMGEGGGNPVPGLPNISLPPPYLDPGLKTEQLSVAINGPSFIWQTILQLGAPYYVPRGLQLAFLIDLQNAVRLKGVVASTHLHVNATALFITYNALPSIGVKLEALAQLVDIAKLPTVNLIYDAVKSSPWIAPYASPLPTALHPINPLFPPPPGYPYTTPAPVTVRHVSVQDVLFHGDPDTWASVLASPSLRERLRSEIEKEAAARLQRPFLSVMCTVQNMWVHYPDPQRRWMGSLSGGLVARVVVNQVLHRGGRRSYPGEEVNSLLFSMSNTLVRQVYAQKIASDVKNKASVASRLNAVYVETIAEQDLPFGTMCGRDWGCRGVIGVVGFLAAATVVVLIVFCTVMTVRYCLDRHRRQKAKLKAELPPSAHSPYATTPVMNRRRQLSSEPFPENSPVENRWEVVLINEPVSARAREPYE